MAAPAARKLAKDIEVVLKKAHEGCEEFDEFWDQIATAQGSQKERLGEELKKVHQQAAKTQIPDERLARITSSPSPFEGQAGGGQKANRKRHGEIQGLRARVQDQGLLLHWLGEDRRVRPRRSRKSQVSGLAGTDHSESQGPAGPVRG
mmetsp:Transcript_49026/g.116693  ORF Transcript_49026/g.116693 Transcript_49026/m.116693 type:complete len:148 (-) Transcript_49026:1164-1607(-)